MPRLASPISWIGGKARLLRHILPLIKPHPGEQIYVEPFGGSGVVLINKDPHPCEAYNDTDGDLVNLFRIIRDPDGVVHLWWELVNTPVSREEFRDALAAAGKNYSPLSPVKRAAAFVVRCRQRFGGAQTGSTHTDTDRCWGTTRGSSRGMSSHVSRWLKALEDLPQVHRRLATVVVDEQDGIRCIRQWDGVQTLFYVDPPYVGAEDYYQGGFKAEDHQRLSDALNGLQGKVVLSYYPCELVEKLYPSRRWHKTVVETFATSCGNAANRTGKKGKVRDCQKRTELLLTNFDPRTRKRL